MSIRVNGKVIASNGDVKTETDNLVTTDTNQTITATKVFTAEQQKKSTVIDITTQPENYSPNNAFRFLDKNGKISGWIENAQMASGEITTGIHARNKDGYQPRVSVFAPLTGMTGAYAIAPITPEDAPIDAITTKGYVDSKSGGLELLDITFAPLGIDESKNKRRYLNGQVLIQEQFPAFTAAVKARMSTMANAFTTETNWQAEKTNSKLGQCGKFVIDDTAGTIRLPCVINAQGLTNLALIGGIKSESLPNITGVVGFSDARTDYISGAFTARSIGVLNSAYSGTSQQYVADFSASSSSSTYQNNAPVQQEAVQYPYCIVVNTGAEEAERPINNYQVNNVYSYGMSQYYKGTMNNNSWLKSAGQWNDGTVYTGMYNWLLEQRNAGVSGFAFSTDRYTDYDFVVNQTDQTFRLPLIAERILVAKKEATTTKDQSWYNLYSDGWLEQGGLGPSGTGNKTITLYKPYSKANYTIIQTPYSASGAGSYSSAIKSQTNTSFVLAVESNYDVGFCWTTCGYTDTAQNTGWNLYYYIGDTLQNAQLINVARIEEKLVTKTNKVQAAEASMPSSRYIDLTLGASGTTYTAPANGWFSLLVRGLTNLDMHKSDTISFGLVSYPYRGDWAKQFVPVLKGDTITTDYEGTPDSITFRFFYAEGDQ